MWDTILEILKRKVNEGVEVRFMYDEVDMRVGTITAVSLNKRARKPAYKITVDLGDFGTKNSSAQLTNYEPEELVGKQVVCVCNFEPMRIGDVKSEVRLLGSDTDEGCVSSEF